MELGSGGGILGYVFRMEKIGFVNGLEKGGEWKGRD